MTGGIDPLTFAHARLYEDEAVAKAAQEIASSDTELGQQAGPCISDATYTFIVGHGPARALREITVKRAILAMAEGQPTHDLAEETAKDALEDVVRVLAFAWSDHPDYDPDWMP